MMSTNGGGGDRHGHGHGNANTKGNTRKQHCFSLIFVRFFLLFFIPAK